MSNFFALKLAFATFVLGTLGLEYFAQQELLTAMQTAGAIQWVSLLSIVNVSWNLLAAE